ncbi:MAG: amino acid ABC transporter substrate-binding protein [Pseudomonadota bacterium]
MQKFLIAVTALASLGVTAPQAAAGDLAAVLERGEIRLGHRGDAPPFSYLDAEGQPAGLAVALCKEIASAIGFREGVDLTTKFVQVTAANRFDALEAGETDLHCGPASATLGRRETLDFSILYFVDAAVSLVRPGSYETVFDVEDGPLGVNKGTTSERMARDLMTGNGLDGELKRFAGHGEGLDALVARDIDAYFGDRAIMQFQIRAKELDGQIEILPDEFSFEPYAMVMKRGHGDLRLAVDRALSEIYDSGLIYNFIQDELGDYRLSPLNRSLYQIIGLPG